MTAVLLAMAANDGGRLDYIPILCLALVAVVVIVHMVVGDPAPGPDVCDRCLRPRATCNCRETRHGR